ncbi:hypothetical protein EIN_344210 [Entamoeba invadens IP1]|uniref:Methyltransferase type 11 domain-containing protein n=1 Tax=Entamoeba invadens IP1 TaxID=370355 RepID=A0A0A1U355_ENTIV|nr:hypothetical protein EIN_344210 [Entamoeba invadens IP1]ELP88491.1 hypothetical protein EIN_344210 [Entamoeba invadens IP1]|eukprot:XP_004255262.1 hypothetical protein EIN_344210 [Entamoeba invadens IP1]
MCETPEVEIKNVREVYEVIASHFSETRYKGWPKVESFLKSLPPHAVVLDVGSGNGKYHNVNKDIQVVGFDQCYNLLLEAVAHQHSQNVQSDSLALPVKSGFADFAISVAVIHHFSSEERRVAAIQEIVRVLKIGGKAIITVWAKEQAKFEKREGQDLMVEWHLQKGKEKKSEINEPEAKTGKDGEKVYERYYHVFVKGELENLVNQIHECKVVESGFEKDNYYVIVSKVSEAN